MNALFASVVIIAGILTIGLFLYLFLGLLKAYRSFQEIKATPVTTITVKFQRLIKYGYQAYSLLGVDDKNNLVEYCSSGRDNTRMYTDVPAGQPMWAQISEKKRTSFPRDYEIHIHSLDDIELDHH